MKNEYKVFIVGMVLMFLFGFIFISTGVETFTRNTLFGMPIWLPILWGYGMVAGRRVGEYLIK